MRFKSETNEFPLSITLYDGVAIDDVARTINHDVLEMLEADDRIYTWEWTQDDPRARSSVMTPIKGIRTVSERENWRNLIALKNLTVAPTTRRADYPDHKG